MRVVGSGVLFEIARVGGLLVKSGRIVSVLGLVWQGRECIG